MFYAQYLGFEAEPTPREDGTLILHADGFSLALGRADEPPASVKFRDPDGYVIEYAWEVLEP